VERCDVAIIGGGIAGLAAAWKVLRLQPTAKVLLFEAGPDAGGKLGTGRVAGITVDTAADAFLARVPGAVDLAIELGLEADLVAPATGQAAVLSGGVLRTLPTGLVLGVPTDADAVADSGILTADGLAALRRDEVQARPVERVDRSVTEAIAPHLGIEVVQRLVDPLLGGISAANCDDLSIESAWPQIAAAACEPHLMAALRSQQLATARGQIGVSEARPVFLAPSGGVHQLVRELTVQLGEVVRCNTAVTSLRQKGASWVISSNQRTDILAGSVILATPAPVSAGLLEAFPQCSARLASIRYASVALLVMAYRSGDVELPDGSGMLVPRPENRFVTAASWWNHKWPHLATDEISLVRASVGRIDDVRFQALDDESLIATVHNDLASFGGARFSQPPVDVHVARWNDSFAQYDVGHLGRVEELERQLPEGVFLAGASLRGVGLPACVRSANDAAIKAVERVGQFLPSPMSDR
jgi:protoporphyrinogen/coproporphyrinogen III oxidase